MRVTVQVPVPKVSTLLIPTNCCSAMILLAPVSKRKFAVAAPGSGIEITEDCPMTLLRTVVLKAPPALRAEIIKLPLAVVDGKDIKVPAWASEPADTLPARALKLPRVNAKLPVAIV